MSWRHSRQRSSVSVKKRSSMNQDRGTNIDDIHNNALIATEPVAHMQDSLSLGSPYPGTQASGNGRMESMHNEFDDEAEWSEKENRPVARDPTITLDEMTTRTELDLFEDDEDGRHSSTSTTSSQAAAAPSLPPKELSRLPMRKIKAISKDASTPLSPYSGPRSPAFTSAVTATPSRQRSFNGMSSTPASISGDRRLSLLAGGSLLGPSPLQSLSDSPSSIRTVTPTSAHHRVSSTAKRMHPVKRMSLSYVPSPVTRSKFSGSMSYEATTPSAVGTPPASSSSRGGYFGRLQDSSPSTPRLASTGSVVDKSVTSTSPALVRSARREDGDTVMTQHMDILGRIAQGERRILELKEMLEKEEMDLRKLQQEWQTSVNRELIASRPDTLQVNGNDPSAMAEDSVIKGVGLEDRSRNADQATMTAASEGWKAISARLAGAGTQLNAFIDQLAAPLPEEGRRSEETVKVTPTGLGLDVLREEAEEGDVVQEGRNRAPPVPPATKSATSTHTKRASVFGNSISSLQKQMEAQFGVVDTKKQDAPAIGDSGGWGTWQKRLKEARENASGLLAKAEAKLGQALTMDDLPNNAAPSTSSSTRKRSPSNIKSPNGGNLIDLEGDNDREKAALAELSWLNSLAGINMSGTTDRVVTSQSSEVRNRNYLPSNESAEQDSSLTRKTSNSSRRMSSTSHARTSRASNTTLATTVTSGAYSPDASLNGEGIKEQSFFSSISSGWGPEPSDEKRVSKIAPSHKKQPSNGHSKTRIAAEVAMKESRSSVPPAQDNEASDEVAWGWA